MIALEDLKGMTEQEVKTHIVEQYSGVEDSWDSPTPEQQAYVSDQLDSLDVLIAYESVGSWGCDSSSFFLFRNKETGKLYELHASHCSCYGFEGQFSLEESVVEALRYRASNGHVFGTGGYDDNEDGNTKAVNEYVLNEL